MSVFFNPPETYTRDYNILKDATEQLALHLSISEGISYADAYDYVREITAKDGEFQLQNPVVTYLEREENGDRVEKQQGLLEHIYGGCREEYVITPNFTMYLPPKVLESKPAKYIIGNMKKRGIDKKKMFEYDMAGEVAKYLEYKSKQEFQKVKNNSVSGMHASPSTPWYCKTIHSSLTSMCRCATSYANANNEKFLAGLRHYFNPLVTYSHILVSIRYGEHDLVKEAVETFNLVLPDVDQCMTVLLRSSRQYWHSDYHENSIRKLFEGMTPVQRAAWVYGGDLFHMDMFNTGFVGTMLNEFTTMVEGEHEDAGKCIKGLDDNFTAISSLLCSPLIQGMSLKDASTKNLPAYNAIALTADKMADTCEKYRSVIYGLLRENYLPVSIYDFPESIRGAIPTSDTDSTIFTTQHFVDLHGGDVPFSHRANSIQYVVTFMIAGLTSNVLMNYSSNLGMAKEHIQQTKMKNEYIFPVYALTPLVKHYFTLITAGEGNVYAESERKLVAKGVNLRSSNAPEYINEEAQKYMRFIIDSVMENKQLTMRDIIEPVLTIENSIISDIKKGGFEFLTRTNVKEPGAYSQGVDAPPYKSYLLWEKVFADKYGAAPNPPYRGVKVKLDLPNPMAINKWLATIEDAKIRDAIHSHVKDNELRELTSFRFPLINLGATGMPKEVIDAINYRAIVYEVMSPFYIILESLGIFLVNKKMTRLLSDEYSLEGETIQ